MFKKNNRVHHNAVCIGGMRRSDGIGYRVNKLFFGTFNFGIVAVFFFFQLNPPSKVLNQSSI